MRTQYDRGGNTLERPAASQTSGSPAAPWATGCFAAVERWTSDGDERTLKATIQACLQAAAAASGNQEQVEATAIQLALDHAESIDRLYRKDDTVDILRAKIEHRKQDRSFFASLGKEGESAVAEADTEIALLEKRLRIKATGTTFHPPPSIESRAAQVVAGGGGRRSTWSSGNGHGSDAADGIAAVHEAGAESGHIS